MYKFLFFLFMLSAALLHSQAPFSCGILQAQEYAYAQDKTARARIEALMKAAEEQPNMTARPGANTSYTIPVVFHVLHLGGPENISDAQIIDQVSILNRDYNKQNADTSSVVAQFQGLIGKADIHFALATKDPNGNCTNGITRHYDSHTDWTTYDNSYYAYTWDRTRYLNIYVVRNTPAGAAAFANYPGAVSAQADAVVVGSTYVGSIGSGSNYTSRVITHEVGHWMNLEHLWGNNNNAGVACGDDGVNDTPVTKGHTYCSLNNAIDCTAGVTENMQNYMDYAYCQRMFTPGQCARMQNALNSAIAGRNNIWTTNNLMATGVLNPLSNCAPVAAFISSTTLTCLGGTAGFIDESYNAPVTYWKWSSPQASGSSLYQNGTLTFTASGAAAVQLKVSNSYGSDSTVQQSVLVLAGAGSGSVNIAQSFETINFPDNKWLANVPAQGVGFQKTGTASFNGFNCLWIDNYSNSPKGQVSLYTPAFNFQNVSNPQISFYYAYAQLSAANADLFKVYASTNCGLGWTQIYTKNSGALSTTGAPLGTAFTNPAYNDWRHEILSLGAFIAGSPQVYFKFEFTPALAGAGNNFYLDDINLTGTITTGIQEQAKTLGSIVAAPNPFSGQLTVSGPGVDQLVSYSLIDISGRMVLGSEKLSTSQNVLEIDGLQDLGKGIYFIKLNSPGESRVLKVLKE